MTQWLLKVLLALVVGTAGALAVEATPSTPAPAATGATPTRVLLLGDSVTHGSSGDWTWRYRLWRHLQGVAAGVDLVGPSRGLFDMGPGGTGTYADRAFDQDHAGLWGRSAAQGEELVEELVGTHAPHVLVVGLGLNDLVFFGATPGDVLASLERIVHRARLADPDLDVVLTEITQTWFPGVREVDEGLPGLAARLTTPLSAVVVARAAAGYRIEHTWDTSHPAPRGEVRIAAAVADALAAVGVGEPHARPLPAVPGVPRTPPEPRARVRERVVVVRWSAPPGATAYAVQVRRAATGRWRTVADGASERSLRISLRAGRHRVRVAGLKGTVRGAWSQPLTVRVR